MSKKILVVDDESLILTAVERALARVGYIIARAQDREEFDKALDAGPFDLLITDVYMQWATLEEVIALVRAGSPAARVLKMSGAIHREKEADFIEKPFSIETLRKKVKETLDGPS